MKHDHIDDTNERLAREFYDAYWGTMGYPLPPSSEFFEDPGQARQANAYRAAVAAIVPPASYAMEADPREPEDDLSTAEVIAEIRMFLEAGATITATDLNGPVLEKLPGGNWHGGMTVTFPEGTQHGPFYSVRVPGTTVSGCGGAAPVVIGADYEPPLIIGGGADAIDPDADLDDPLPPRTCGDGETCDVCQ